jgi:hypothetical protein
VTNCDPGTFETQTPNASRDRTCGVCTAGNYSAGTNDPACTACAAGTAQPTAGQASCADCAAGTFSASSGATGCTACSPGSYQSNTGQTDCTLCAAGTAQASSGASSCPSCTLGTSYAADAGQSSCDPLTSCAPGTYVSTVATTSSDRTCAACDGGTFSSTSNQTFCAAWTTCGPTEVEVDAGTSTSDRVCMADGGCVAGAFALTAGATVGTSNFPIFSAMGDYDEDGILDLAVTSQSAATVSVALGNGDGTFAASTAFSTGASSNPWDIATGDLNRDGHLDLAIVTDGTNTLSVMLGDGTGAFAAPLTTAVALQATRLALADLNRDGILDAIVATNSPSALTVFLGVGNGTFAAGVQNPSGGVNGNPEYVGVGDLNRDGLLDLTAANLTGGTVSVLLGTGGGSFAAAVTYPVTGTLIRTSALGDVNRDGVLDIVAATSNPASVSVLLGNGNGTFAAAVAYPASGPTRDADLADVNGDGMLDVVTVNPASSAMYVHLGNGTGAFASSQTFASGTTTTSAEVADVNSDGRADIVAVNTGAASARVFLNSTTTCPASFATSTSSPTGGNQPFSLTTGDLNGDGIPDVVAANTGGNSVGVTFGVGDGTFDTPATYGTGGITSVQTGDFNRDGKLDVIAADPSNDVIWELLGASNGSGTLTGPTPIPATVNAGPNQVRVGDFDRNGTLDMASANPGSHTVSVWLGTGNGSFAAVVDYAMGNGSSPYNVAVADVNRDGRQDLVVVLNGFNGVAVMLGNGSGAFGAPNLISTGANTGPAAIAVGDVNSDGKLDVVTANLATDDASVLLGNGDGTFQTPVFYGSGGAATDPDHVVVADLNRDGKLDFALANRAANTVALRTGNGDGTFGPVALYSVAGPDLLQLAAADFDRDGKLDLACINAGSVPGTFSVLRGQ